MIWLTNRGHDTEAVRNKEECDDNDSDNNGNDIYILG